MAEQGSYPLNGRTLAGTDTVTGVVTGQTADIPLSVLASFVDNVPVLLFGSTANRPNPASYIAQPYLDTTLGFMIWSTSTAPTVWINAAGVAV